MGKYTPARVVAMKQLALTTALWHGAHDDAAIQTIRRYAFERSDAPAAVMEELPFTDILSIAIEKLMSFEPARAARLFGECSKRMTVEDAFLFRAFVFSVHQRHNLLSFAPYLSGNIDSRYFLAAVLMALPRLAFREEDFETLTKFSGHPWSHYHAKNLKLYQDIDYALMSLKCAPVGNALDKDYHQKAIATSLFGPLWSELYVVDIFHFEDIIRDILRQRPPFLRDTKLD